MIQGAQICSSDKMATRALIASESLEMSGVSIRRIQENIKKMEKRVVFIASYSTLTFIIITFMIMVMIIVLYIIFT